MLLFAANNNKAVGMIGPRSEVGRNRWTGFRFDRGVINDKADNAKQRPAADFFSDPSATPRGKVLFTAIRKLPVGRFVTDRQFGRQQTFALLMQAVHNSVQYPRREQSALHRVGRLFGMHHVFDRP